MKLPKINNTYSFQVTLAPGQVLRLPADTLYLQVEAGYVWISNRGQDVTLSVNQTYTPEISRDGALLSASGGKMATIRIHQSHEHISSVLQQFSTSYQ